MLIECIDKSPLAFHVLPFGNPKAQRTLQAPSLEVKQTWCHQIKRVILDNFDATIPERAKHLVLHIEELSGKNNHRGGRVSDIVPPTSLWSQEVEVGDNERRASTGNIFILHFYNRSKITYSKIAY